MEKLFKQFCKVIHKQFAGRYGNLYKAEFDNLQQVIKVNNSFNNMHTYEETHCEFHKIKAATKIILESKANNYSFTMLGKRKGEDVILMSINFKPLDIYGDNN